MSSTFPNWILNSSIKLEFSNVSPLFPNVSDFSPFLPLTIAEEAERILVKNPGPGSRLPEFKS